MGRGTTKTGAVSRAYSSESPCASIFCNRTFTITPTGDAWALCSAQIGRRSLFCENDRLGCNINLGLARLRLGKGAVLFGHIGASFALFILQIAMRPYFKLEPYAPSRPGAMLAFGRCKDLVA